MRVTSTLLLGTCLAGAIAIPASAQGVLAKARYARPVIAGAVAGMPAQALPLPVAAAPGVAGVADGAGGGAVGIGVDGGVTFTPAVPCGVDDGAVCGVAPHPGDLPGGDLPPLSIMPLLPSPDGIAPPAGIATDAMVAAVETGIAPGAAPSQQVIAVTGTPTPAALLRAANAANAAAATSAAEAPGLAAQIRAQVRAAGGSLRSRGSGGKTIGIGVAAFGTPADARPLVTTARMPGAPAQTSGPAAGLPQVHVPRTGPTPAAPLPAGTGSATSTVATAGSQATAVAAPAARAGVAAALGGAARVVAPAGSGAPRWRDRFSFASPLGR